MGLPVLGFHAVGGRLGGTTAGQSLEQRPTYGQPDKAPMTGDHSGRVYRLARERPTIWGVPSRPSIVLKNKKKQNTKQNKEKTKHRNSGTQQDPRSRNIRMDPVAQHVWVPGYKAQRRRLRFQPRGTRSATGRQERWQETWPRNRNTGLLRTSGAEAAGGGPGAPRPRDGIVAGRRTAHLNLPRPASRAPSHSLLCPPAQKFTLTLPDLSSDTSGIDETRAKQTRLL